MPFKPVSAVNYFGGKAHANRGVGRWIQSKLPRERKVLYVETHAGMLGVLLGRPESKREIANDLNGRVINWWRVVRTRYDEFLHYLTYTPFSEREYNEAVATIDDGDDLERAWKFHVVVAFSMFHADGQSGGFGITYSIDGGQKGGNSAKAQAVANRLEAIRERIINVQFLNRPAIKILRRIEKLEHAVVYVDPPYRNADTKTYAIDQQDYEETLDSLKRQTGRVAVSGYDDDWDALDWHRSEFATWATRRQGCEPSTEVLWTNYRPDIQEELM